MGNRFIAKIAVVGIGGGGCNAVDYMMRNRIKGVSFFKVNTDAQVLGEEDALDSKKDQNQNIDFTEIQIGQGSFEGLGAGSKPEVGEQAANKNISDIMLKLEGIHMVFLVAGMGGGTGTGATPIIAQKLREKGILVIAFVTKPFKFEGRRRMEIAEEGIKKLRSCVDTLIVIPNQKLLELPDENEHELTFLESFELVDETSGKAVQGISDLITIKGIINLDFADVKTATEDAGEGVIGIGVVEGKGEGKDKPAVQAAEKALECALIDREINGASRVIINVSGPETLGMKEVNEAVARINAEAAEGALIIFGGIANTSITSTTVTILASDFEGKIFQQQTPKAEEVAKGAGSEGGNGQKTNLSFVKEAVKNA